MENLSDHLKSTAAAMGRALVEQMPDPDWCYVCDRPANDCACHLDPNGPLPNSACVRLDEALRAELREAEREDGVGGDSNDEMRTQQERY